MVKRLAFFLFFLCLFVVALYGIGVVQGFMDDTQLMLLGFSRYLGLALFASGLLGFVMKSILFFQNKKARLALGAGAYLFAGLLGFAAAMVSIFIIAASHGNYG
ncbi:MAG: hypothetical protein LBF78_09590 [Treponema sp.]|nr:hypothetical protein [Treponema sp.]